MKPIDGDDMLRRVNFLLATIYTPEFVEILTALKEYLEKAPALTLDDLRPKGRWVNVRRITTGDGRVRIGFCSCCGSAEKLKKYCPNCGADMRGGGEDG